MDISFLGDPLFWFGGGAIITIFSLWDMTAAINSVAYEIRTQNNLMREAELNRRKEETWRTAYGGAKTRMAGTYEPTVSSTTFGSK